MPRETDVWNGRVSSLRFDSGQGANTWDSLDQGSFATYSIWKAAFLFAVPNSIEPEYAAPLMCGGATVFNVLQSFNARPTDRVGIIGIGLLAVPVLAGSSSYAISEALGIKEGLYRKFGKAKGFYAIIALATLTGLLINFLGIDPIQALIFTAVFNAIASVPLLWMIYRVGNNATIMGAYKNSRWSNAGVLAAFSLISVATIVLFFSLIP